MFQRQSDGTACLTSSSFEVTELGFEPRESDSQSLGLLAPAPCLLPGGPGDPGSAPPTLAPWVLCQRHPWIPAWHGDVPSLQRSPVYLSEPDGAKVILLKISHQAELEKGRQVWTREDPEIKGPRPEKRRLLCCELTGLIHSHPGHSPNKCIARVPKTTD